MLGKCSRNNTSITIPVALADIIDKHIETHQDFRSRAELTVYAIRRLLEMNHNNGGPHNG
jgi:Arc/MetJ-type ribon-helix-helix transcriptional regulator